MADTTTELEVLDQIVDVLGGQSGQHKTVVPVLEDIRDLLSGGGGGGGGYNPSLSVGRADALTGADSTAQWATRESTGSGAATVRSVQGAAVGWNQLAPALAASNYTAYQLTDTSFSDGVFTGTIVDTTSSIFRNIAYTANHRYMLLADVKAPEGVSVALVFTYAGVIMSTKYITGTGDFVRDAAFYKPTNGPSGGNDRYMVRNLAAESVGAEISVKNIQLFDLTAMFGSGNEPTTVAEFEAMYPESYYPYSAPTLKSVQIAGIASTDANGDALGGVEWPTQTLRAAGSVADMLYSDHVETRVGVVDLGTLTWYKSDDLGGAPVYYAMLADVAAAADNDVVSVSCAALNGVSAGYLYSHPSELNVISLNANKLLWARHSAADAAAFKAAMQGAMLTYPIATPTTTPISPALPMTYRVEQGGTESIVVPEGEISAAPLLTIAEGESAAELVMDALAAIAAPDGPVATSNHALGTYLTMGGKLYKVTSAIAVGETIKSGTNVSQTTVMAELIARTA